MREGTGPQAPEGASVRGSLGEVTSRGWREEGPGHHCPVLNAQSRPAPAPLEHTGRLALQDEVEELLVLKGLAWERRASKERTGRCRGWRTQWGRGPGGEMRVQEKAVGLTSGSWRREEGLRTAAGQTGIAWGGVGEVRGGAKVMGDRQ